ncbi:uncharacterized protein LOC135105998 [Scylla paramamosain]|uniref:uncharacterized protein LOC135105998 n=1 Tax=Scylla paramamosain TaxID=85552 RepID=UPI0030838F36
MTPLQLWMCWLVPRMSAWVGNRLAVCCVALLSSLSVGEAPRPRGRGETLEAAGAAAAAVLARAWQPHCCVILLTDGTTSTHAVVKGLQQLAAPRGAAVLESGPVRSTLNKTLQYARSVRRLSWCVVVVVVSDDPSFFASWAELALESGLLAWSTRLVALTGLPTSALSGLYLTFSFANAVLVVSDGGSPPRWVVQRRR